MRWPSRVSGGRRSYVRAWSSPPRDQRPVRQTTPAQAQRHSERQAQLKREAMERMRGP